MLRHLTSSAFALLITMGTAGAQNGTDPGAGNALAIKQAESSALVSSARSFILQTLSSVEDLRAREATRDAIDNARTCVAHRVGVTESHKAAIFGRLRAEGLLDLGDDDKFAGGLMLGIFPPLIDDGGACPRAPQTYWSAPGSVFEGHHSHPGGLAIHVAFNLSSFLSFADNYRRVYGSSGGATGLPTVVQPGRPSPDAGRQRCANQPRPLRSSRLFGTTGERLSSFSGTAMVRSWQSAASAEMARPTNMARRATARPARITSSGSPRL